jgi:phosphoribosylanthranilate isomerase
MTVSVKICGITTPQAAEAVLAAGADFGGLVFFPRSPRHISLDQARTLARIMRGRLKVVTLMVDPTDAEVSEVITAVNPDLVQLHGKETPARVAAIASLVRRPLIKAIAVADSADAAAAATYEEVADYYLFDAKADSAATRPGGLGAAFDWQLLSGRSFKRPWGVAGGLSPDNVARAIRIAGPAFVDTSSGVEDAPGQKSRDKVVAFVQAARGAQYTDQKAGAA